MHKRFNIAVVCESTKHKEQDRLMFMTFVESKMVRCRYATYTTTYMLVFKCEDCEATATIIDNV